ncbi:MAG: hypothetical protein ACOC2W_03550 [bacterium]
MKAYGITIKDLPRDCTGTGKYGSDKLLDKCVCGKNHGKKTKDHKSRKAKMRNEGINMSE